MIPWYGYTVCHGVPNTNTIPIPVVPVTWSLWVFLYLCWTLEIECSDSEINRIMLCINDLRIPIQDEITRYIWEQWCLYHGGYTIHICISYSLAYLKCLNKYALTTNVSTYVKYVNTFACQNYLHKIVWLCIFIPACQKQICRAQLSYINRSDTQMYWHISHMQKHLRSMHIYLNILNMLKNS